MSQYDRVKVRDVMANTYAVVDGLTTVYEAIQLAKEKQIKALIVAKRHDDDEFGIVLMNDIAKKVLANNRSLERTNIYEIMTKPALGVEPEMKVKNCARLFERFGISRAPVIENGQVIGMVSYNNMVVNGLLSDTE
ncbi:CBS domain-containing protein [Vibrio quintilis]|uniref:Putative voltage-gated ClC-type chloride channel ClcB n=1 Tax=Vibrio quintilis TaxID=1117707 RepID=A0A1M7YZF3_9VIBR|nr:CBS domain-containing protein [Vibrio quintilis]SHO57974.1 putative voltage-gated ClC-type chloride channel ClcB [Vibrio quintilis]